MRTQITSVALQALMIGKSRRICFQVQKSYGARIPLPFLLIIAQKKLQRFFSHFRSLGTSVTDFFPDLGFDNCLLERQLFLLSQYGHPPASRLFWRTNTGRSLKDALH